MHSCMLPSIRPHSKSSNLRVVLGTPATLISLTPSLGCHHSIPNCRHSPLISSLKSIFLPGAGGLLEPQVHGTTHLRALLAPGSLGDGPGSFPTFPGPAWSGAHLLSSQLTPPPTLAHQVLSLKDFTDAVPYSLKSSLQTSSKQPNIWPS